MTAKSLVSALAVLGAATVGAVFALAGSTTAVASPQFEHGAALVAKVGPASPAFAALPAMTDEQAVVFLTTGKRPEDRLPRPAPPDFRLSEEDARAVVAYLRTTGKKS